MGRRSAASPAVLLVLGLVLGPAACGSSSMVEQPGTRAVASRIDARNVRSLAPQWRFRIPGPDTFSGVETAPPLVVGDRVYLETMDSDVIALDRATGRRLWITRFRRQTGGPNGLAFVDQLIYGSTDIAAFALDAHDGSRRWVHRLTTSKDPITIQQVVANGVVYTSTTGRPPGGKGAVYGLDAKTGGVRWRFVTIEGEWAIPHEAGGGGLWWPVSVDGDGHVYAGNSNPLPWGGTPAHPNGGAYRGRALYTDSLLVFDGADGRLLWYDQVVPHDVRDYDFAVTPLLFGGLIVGAGKGGVVVAWDRASHRRVWSTRCVGIHRNDIGPLSRRRVTVCPGLLGGVLTPMAASSSRVFVPVVDLCMRGSATGYPRFLSVPYGSGKGELVALRASDGQMLWRRRFPSPDFGCATVTTTSCSQRPTTGGCMRCPLPTAERCGRRGRGLESMPALRFQTTHSTSLLVLIPVAQF